MIHHLRGKISKITNWDKATVRHEISISWEQPTVLCASFKKIKTAKKKLNKWNVTVSDYDIFIHVMKQIYDTNWFPEKHMTEQEEREDRNSWEACKMLFEWCYITCK